MSRPRLLDLFCGAGGAGMGYHRAGFDVTGVDLAPQPRYPFPIFTADALDFLARNGHEYDAIHASPPCQRHVTGYRALNQAMGRNVDDHPDLVLPTITLLEALGIPWVVENVEGAPLISGVRVCGSAFGLPIRRHRRFQSSHLLFGTECNHGLQTEEKYWTASRRKDGSRRRSRVVQVYGKSGETWEWGPAMGIDWMMPAELAQAIPPAYTEYLGRQLLVAIKQTAEAAA